MRAPLPLTAIEEENEDEPKPADDRTKTEIENPVVQPHPEQEEGGGDQMRHEEGGEGPKDEEVKRDQHHMQDANPSEAVHAEPEVPR